MENIIIYTQDSDSEIQKLLENTEDYSIRVKKTDEIREAEQLNPQVIVVETNDEDAKNIFMCNKFSAPVLVAAQNILEGVTVRADSYDYILKPYKQEELKVRIKNLLKIKQLKNEINVVATTDELTGLYNRKYLHERLEAEISRAKRYNLKLSCLLLDIDFFKVVNDMYGYDWGDVLLKKITEILKQYVRKEDILTRYGDEEFIIILPNTDEDNAYLFAERLRRDIEKMEFMPDGEEEPHPITISGGISCYPYLENTDESANTLIRYAEHALYNAKKRGKNKMIQFSQINLDF
ncbi:MAG: GGDEF domain-containing protein [Candidatus Gastranaerophilales bacterium]|nr:GGDEF domain-containing protein [Candidatus Gastranaerophilales bacterium]